MDRTAPVLVVDDFRTMSLILSKLLRQNGFTQVDQVHDGYSALDGLRQKRYGLVITDWNMEPISGPQLVLRMKKEPALSTIPVILMTAQGSRHDEAWLAGADAYLNKPFTTDELMSAIEEVFARRADESKAAS
jgi:two-component system chemotaxis response regulator CheY